MPPPNPYGQPPAGRHASPSIRAEQSFGFAPPSSPSFGAPAGAAAGYGAYPQAPPAQQYRQPADDASGYQTPGYPTDPPAQQYPAPVKPPRSAKPSAKFSNTGLALGVIGVIGGIFFGWTLLLSIAAIVLGSLARPREPHARGVALSAIVTGAVGVLLSLGWLTYSILTWLALTAS
ncbi:MAG: DUF4190 domain-containing protein [Mycetocola sp.]